MRAWQKRKRWHYSGDMGYPPCNRAYQTKTTSEKEKVTCKMCRYRMTKKLSYGNPYIKKKLADELRRLKKYMGWV